MIRAAVLVASAALAVSGCGQEPAEGTPTSAAPAAPTPAEAAFEGRTIQPTATWGVGKGPDALYLDSSAGLLYVANVEDTRVTVLDVASGGTRAEFAVPLGPWGFVELPGRLLAVSSWEKAITLIDLDEVATTRSFALPFYAGGMVATPDGSRLFAVAPQEDRVYPVDAATGEVGSPLTTEAGPDGVGILADGGGVVVANTEAGSIQVLDSTTGVERARHVVGGKPELVHGSANDQWLLVSNFFGDSVHVLDAASGDLARTIAGIDGPEEPVTDAAASRLFVAAFEAGFVQVHDLATGQQLPVRLRTGTKPIGVVVAGDDVYVSNYGDDTVTAYTLDEQP